MGGISGSGLISGIDTASLIEQLIAVSSGPKILAQNRLMQLQFQQAAYLDLNSQLNSLKSAAASFRVDSVFQTMKATSSNTDILNATTSIGAQPGTYSFIVDRLVSSRQLLSRGFQDQNASAVGASEFTFESFLGRLDRDLSLSALNDGNGIERGSIRVNVGADSAEIDLSRAATVQDVLDEINNSGLNVTARVRDGRFEIVGATSVSNTGTADTAESLGLSGGGAGVVSGVYTGFRVYEMTGNISLASLNDGNGVDYSSVEAVTGGVSPDFQITIDGTTTVDVGLGNVWGDDGEGGFEITEAAISTVQGVLDRINQAFADEVPPIDATASIDATTGSITIATNDGSQITDIAQSSSSQTLRDLGIAEFSGGTGTSVTGSRIFSGMGTTLISGLNGGGASGGIGGDGLLTFTDRDDASATIDINALASFNTVEGMLDELNNELANQSIGITLSLSDAGTGLMATDTTGQTTSALIITGTGGNDTAASLGISTGATGVTEDAFQGSSLQRRYVGEATRLDSLNGGDGIGTGKFRLIDATGAVAEVVIDDNEVTIADLIKQIEGQIGGSLALTVGINSQGDGIVITDTSGTGTTIQIEDVTGSVASKLGIEGTAESAGANNYIDGSFETTVEFDVTDTLEDIVAKINNAGGPAAVSILNDGTGMRPYRLSFTARESGSAGRFTFDSNGFDLGLNVLDEGDDARVFFGSANAATGILLTSSSNTLDDVITGVNIDLSSTGEEAVQVTITDDTAAIEAKVGEFIEAYNRVISSMSNSTRYNADTGERGALLGDGLVLGLRGGLFSAIQSSNFGFSDSINRLGEAGITVGAEGKLEFDTDIFRDALASDPTAVEDLFSRRTIDEDGGENSDLPDGITINDPGAVDSYSEMGVMVLIEEFAKNYTDSIDGILTSRSQSLDTQILSQRGRIEDLQEGLDRQRAALEMQFIAMEQALAQLQSQQSALSTLSSLG